MTRPRFLSDDMWIRLGGTLWAIVALLTGALLAAWLAPDGDAGGAGVRMPLPPVVFTRPMPDGPISWDDVVTGYPPASMREAVVAAVKQCLDGPLVSRRDPVQASWHPWNKCACLAAEASARYTPEEMARLAPTLRYGSTPRFALIGRWMEIARTCQGQTGERRLPPRTPPH